MRTRPGPGVRYSPSCANFAWLEGSRKVWELDQGEIEKGEWGRYYHWVAAVRVAVLFPGGRRDPVFPGGRRDLVAHYALLAAGMRLAEADRLARLWT